LGYDLDYGTTVFYLMDIMQEARARNLFDKVFRAPLEKIDPKGVVSIIMQFEGLRDLSQYKGPPAYNDPFAPYSFLDELYQYSVLDVPLLITGEDGHQQGTAA